MTKRRWVKHNGKLCLEGYPIRIIRPGPNGRAFGLEHDGRTTLAYETLAMPKLDTKRQADEIDEFVGAQIRL